MSLEQPNRPVSESNVESKKATETEVRFLIDLDTFVEIENQLTSLGAVDKGLSVTREDIFYPSSEKTDARAMTKVGRIRDTNGTLVDTIKSFPKESFLTTEETTYQPKDQSDAVSFLTDLGFSFNRSQEQIIHAFDLDDVEISLRIWPAYYKDQMPPCYIEIEGDDVSQLEAVACQLGFDWNTREIRHPLILLNDVYDIPVQSLCRYTFSTLKQKASQQKAE